jgi:hypothetical protein
MKKNRKTFVGGELAWCAAMAVSKGVSDVSGGVPRRTLSEERRRRRSRKEKRENASQHNLDTIVNLRTAYRMATERAAHNRRPVVRRVASGRKVGDACVQ